jgi:FkbM family methyltransferase
MFSAFRRRPDAATEVHDLEVEKVPDPLAAARHDSRDPQGGRQGHHSAIDGGDREHLQDILLDNKTGLGRRTYSIEGEDMLIQRMFDVFVGKSWERKGTYVDLGAYHPILDSNTYHFYNMGWRGVCIEPNPGPIEAFREIRPEDELWKFGVAPTGGLLTYHRFANAGLNGFYGRDLVEQHIQNGQAYLGSTEVPCISVSDLIDRLRGRTVDLLNIDVETLDVHLLREWDWSVCRPKVVCAELHCLLLAHALDSDITRVMREADYSPMCRGWQSVIYVDNQILRAFEPDMGI